MHPVIKALAITGATVGGLAAAAPASAHTSVGFFVGGGPGWGYGYAPGPYWGPPPVYWDAPYYGYGYGWGWGYPHYRHYWRGGWGHRGWGYRGYHRWHRW